MIVKCIKKREGVYQDKHLMVGELYCVLDITFYADGRIDYNLLIETEEQYVALLFPSDNFGIVDGTLPNTWIYADWGGWQRHHLESLAFSNLKGDDIYQNDNIGFIKAVNEILAFHNWPLLEIPEYLLPKPTAEEERKTTINNELEEYLRIAEEEEK
jgi:hypothetical protein